MLGDFPAAPRKVSGSLELMWQQGNLVKLMVALREAERKESSKTERNRDSLL